MSGVYIKGMEMPKNCAWCCFLQSTDPIPKRELFCGIDITNDIHDYKPDKGCPLIPFPPHGKLIDADALREAVGIVEEERRREYYALSEAEKECEYEQGVWDGVHMVAKMISVAPTIIPADKEVEQ